MNSSLYHRNVFQTIYYIIEREALIIYMVVQKKRKKPEQIYCRG